MRRFRCFICHCVTAWALSLSPPVSAISYQVSIDTSALEGAPFALVYDLIDGGTPANAVTISDFVTDGTLGEVSTVGGVFGGLPWGFTLIDTEFFFNEYAHVISTSTNITFRFTTSSNGPAPGSVSDTFSVFLLDIESGTPLFDTSDPVGAASLFTFQIDDGLGLLSVYSPMPPSGVRWTVTAVPEPDAAWLFLCGLLAVIFLTAQRARAPLS